MPSLIFLNPLLLAGLAAAALPLIIHAIFRRRRRRVRFSSLRFLLAGDRRSAQRHRLVDLLVLALRIAMLALLALALAQPVLRPSGAANVAFGHLSVALVIDDTMSMQRSVGGVSLFQQALGAAKTLLDGLPAEAEVRVLLASGRRPAALAAPVSPPASLKTALDDLKCSFGAQTLAPAIGAAVDALAAAKPGHRGIVVMSDMQARAFGIAPQGATGDSEGKPAAGNLKIDAERFEKEIQSVQILDVGGGEKNLGLRAMSIEPPSGFPGEPLRIRAGVFNSGDEATHAAVALWNGAEKMQANTLEIPPRGMAEAVFTMAPQKSGWMPLAVRVEGDSLAADNAQYAVARALPPANVLVILPSPPDATGKNESLYLETALNPLGASAANGAAPVQISRTDEATYIAQSFARYDPIFWIAGPHSPPALLDALTERARAGGQVVIFPATAWLGSAKNERLTLGPWTIRSLRKSTGKSGAAPGFGKIDDEHPIFAMLKKNSPEVFEGASFAAHLDLDETKLGPTDRVVARLTDGAPLLVESHVGAGGILAWTAGARPEFGDWVLRPAFLPLVYETLKRGAASAMPVVVSSDPDAGFELELPAADAPRELTITAPGGGAGYASLGAGEKVLTGEATDGPGIYTVALPNQAEPFPVALNVDPAESDLKRASQDEVAAAFPPARRPVFQTEPAAAAARLSAAAQGVPYAGPLLALALAAFLAETWLANIFLRREARNEASARSEQESKPA